MLQCNTIDLVDSPPNGADAPDDNRGQQWRPAKAPVTVNGHDFPNPAVPRAYPYGIYDVGRNVGFVNVGTDHDTGAFAVTSIRGWWRAEGRRLYPGTREMLITADGGGSNGVRLRLWKWAPAIRE